MKFILALALFCAASAVSSLLLDESDTDGSCDLYVTAALMTGTDGAETYTWYYGKTANAAADGFGGFIWEVEASDAACDDAQVNCLSSVTFGWKVVAVDDADDVTFSGGASISCSWDTTQDVETALTLSDACTFTQDSLTWPDAEDYYNGASNYGQEDSSDDMSVAPNTTSDTGNGVTFLITYDSADVGDCYSMAIGGSVSINTAFAAAFAAISLF